MSLRDLGIVGNCQFNALIDSSGAVQWLCFPRFDSSFVFGGLVDGQCGGHFQIEGAEPGGAPAPPGRLDYLRNTNILRNIVESRSGCFEILDFAPRFIQNERSYRPTMLIRIVRPLAGRPLLRVRCQPVYDYGEVRLQAEVGSHHIEYSGASGRLRLTTNHSLEYLQSGALFALEGPVYFALAWGPPLEGPLEESCENFFQRTRLYWRTWVKHTTLPAEYQREVIRSALILKLHQFEDTGAIIAATTTSIPEAPGSARNWDYRYCWVRDAALAIRAFRMLGHFEEMEGFANFMRDRAGADGGRLQPLYSVAGENALTERELPLLGGYLKHLPVRVGNDAWRQIQNDVYGEMALALTPLYTDERFQADVGPDLSILNELCEQIQRTIGDSDAGIWEYRSISKRNAFTLLMHWVGATRIAAIAEMSGEQGLMLRARHLAAEAGLALQEEYWNEQLGAYVMWPNSAMLDASLLMMVNLGFLQSDDPRARRHVEAIGSGLEAPGGLLYRYLTPDDFGQPETAFLICAFWLAEARCRVGLQQKGRELFQRLLGCANPLGLFSEDFDARDASLWGNFPQAYSHVGLINAAFLLSGPHPV
ncbi:MAG: glycoside hydrolase family 15 protein [Leptospirales bacterium]|nr:glycoside hydrolase family 15 protein [Leptospirales bacterium]